MTGMEEGTSLFSLGAFTLPSGKQTHFKIECDVLKPEDWKALARLAVELLPPFEEVEGVPRGGLMFGDALRRYVTPKSGRLLIADDVWVTGLSMERHRAERNAIGVVAFARNIVDPWVTSLIRLNPRAEEVTYQLNRPYGVIQA